MEAKLNNGYPFDYQELGPEETEELKKYFTPIFTKTIRLGANGYFFHKGFEDTIVEAYNMEVRPSDVFVMSFPRSGSTWTQEIVWLLQNECDFDKAKATVLTKRFSFIESKCFLKVKMPEKLAQSDGYENFVEEYIIDDSKSIDLLPSPRFLKTHLAFSLFPPSLLDTAKVVYLARDPRDVAVSYFLHKKSIHYVRSDTEFKPFWNFFMQNKILWCPYFEHVKEAWNRRNHPNMTFIFYEELSEDLLTVTRRLASFFRKEYSDEQIQALCDHVKFDNFKNNNSVNRKMWQDTGIMIGDFIRKGKCGGWREYFDAEMTQQAENWIADNLRDTDLRFPQSQ